MHVLSHYTDVSFASFFSGGFITAIIVNPPEMKLAKRTSVQWFIRKRNTTYEIGTLASAKQTNASCSSSSKILFFGLVEPTNEYLTILCD